MSSDTIGAKSSEENESQGHSTTTRMAFDSWTLTMEKDTGKVYSFVGEI